MTNLRILNAMFGAKLGGLEQVFVDYSEVLAARGHDVANVVVPGAKSAAPLRALGLDVVSVGNLNQYDPVAVWRLRRAVAAFRPDVVIAHGARAIRLMRRAARGQAALVAVPHNINVRCAVGADFTIAINDDMARRLTAAGQPPERVAQLFNMIRAPKTLAAVAAPKSPPVLGAMGRFVPKKGFDVFLSALALLQAQGRPFQAVLAGTGALDAALKAQAAALGLSEVLRFPGWIEDKELFFSDLDVFVFPSSHDVCPVVLLEAFVWAKPVVLTDCPGPREISSDGVDSLLFPVGDAQALAARIARVLDEAGLAQRLAAAAQAKILAHHTFATAGARLEAIVAKAAR